MAGLDPAIQPDGPPTGRFGCATPWRRACWVGIVGWVAGSSPAMTAGRSWRLP